MCKVKTLDTKGFMRKKHLKGWCLKQVGKGLNALPSTSDLKHFSKTCSNLAMKKESFYW